MRSVKTRVNKGAKLPTEVKELQISVPGIELCRRTVTWYAINFPKRVSANCAVEPRHDGSVAKTYSQKPRRLDSAILV